MSLTLLTIVLVISSSILENIMLTFNTGYSGLVCPQMCTELNSTLCLFVLAEWKEHPKSVSFPIPRQHTRLHILNSSLHQPTQADYSLLWRVLRSPTRAPGGFNDASICFFTGSSAYIRLAKAISGPDFNNSKFETFLTAIRRS